MLPHAWLIQEAEDLVQDTLLRAWKYYHTYRGQGSLKAWLYRIATNTCIDALNKRAHREPPVVPLPDAGSLESEPALALEKMLVEPMPDSWLGQIVADPETQYRPRERVRLAFVVALQSLPPKQRAVLILREVLDLSAKEVAELLELTVSSVHSALHRARSNLHRVQASETLGDLSLQPNDDAMAQLLERYVQAWESANVSELVALMSKDVAFTMPPASIWYRGRDKVYILFTEVLFPGQEPGIWRLVPTGANAQPAFGLFMLDGDTGKYHPYALQVLTVQKYRIVESRNFIYPDYFATFDLPTVLE